MDQNEATQHSEKASRKKGARTWGGSQTMAKCLLYGARAFLLRSSLCFVNESSKEESRMREIRLSGSEGGEAESIGLSYPYHFSTASACAPIFFLLHQSHSEEAELQRNRIRMIKQYIGRRVGHYMKADILRKGKLHPEPAEKQHHGRNHVWPCCPDRTLHHYNNTSSLAQLTSKIPANTIPTRPVDTFLHPQ